MNDTYILDLIFDELKTESSIVLGEFLNQKEILFDDNDIRRLRGIISHSKLANVQNIDTDGGSEALLRLSSFGHAQLNKKTYKEFLSEQQKAAQPTNSIIITAPVTGSQIGQGSNFGNLDLSHNPTALGSTKHTEQPQKDATISKKETVSSRIYKWTDHKLISMVIYGVIAYLLLRLFIYLGWA